MCLCDATELEDDTDPDWTFHSVEQSPTGDTWVFESHSGDLSTLGYIDDDNDFNSVIAMEHGDGPELLSEIVILDDTYVWVNGVGGIYRLVITELDTPNMTIRQGIGEVAFTPVYDYQFYFEVVDDFDIVNDFVWWVEERSVYKMAVTDFGGTPTFVFDLTPDFGTFPGGEKDMLISAASDRLWITKKEVDPTVRSYDFDGTIIEEIPVDSGGVTAPTDMVVERDAEALVLVGQGGGEHDGDFQSNTAFRIFVGGTTCLVEVPTWQGLDGETYTDWTGEWDSVFDTRSVGHGSTAGFVVSVRIGAEL